MPAAIHIIEDDPSVRDAVQELVASDGRAVYAYDGPAAFFAGAPPGPHDIIVLDIHFPVGSGVEIAERLKRDNPEIRIVVISGVRSKEFARALGAIAPAASFRKPIDGPAFAECVRRLSAAT
ncbi:MAG: response regulator [Parvularculaceae bacterium]